MLGKAPGRRGIFSGGAGTVRAVAFWRGETEGRALLLPAVSRVRRNHLPARAFLARPIGKEIDMARALILWLMGVPLFLVILIWYFFF